MSDSPSEPYFVARLRRHFGSDPARLAVVAESFKDYHHPNLHRAVETLSNDADRFDLIGVAMDHKEFGGVSFSKLAAPSPHGHDPCEGPVEYERVESGVGKELACVSSGLFLLQSKDDPIAILINRNQHGPYRQLKVEVLAKHRETADRALARIRHHTRAQNVYQGQIVSLEMDRQAGINLRFHSLPRIDRDGIILPGELLDRIERLTIRFARHSKTLLRAGRHLKRGILLHGPPGTGKTLTAMYLARAMTGRTVLLVTGQSQGLIEQACGLARALAPSMVIIEDVDLIAQERGRPGADCVAPLLFELLNQMDGLADDTDVLFLLTTNRPEALEPALAARPGRIDQAIYVPLPDLDCRRRLFALYAAGLTLRAPIEPVLRKIDGASGAFIRELLRKAALFAADESDAKELVVEKRHIEAALRDLLFDGGTLSRSLLGFAPSAKGRPK